MAFGSDARVREDLSGIEVLASSLRRSPLSLRTLQQRTAYAEPEENAPKRVTERVGLHLLECIIVGAAEIGNTGNGNACAKWRVP